jgi:MFS transporter, OFA family, oxalate/formate antiporter
MSVFNGVGRLAWASFSDKVGRTTVYIIFFVVQIICLAFLIGTKNPVFFMILVFLILSCYGGGFSNMPALLGDLFGTKEVGAIHGYILTAWAVAGIVGPMLIAYVRQTTGHFGYALLVFIILLIVALIISILLLIDIKRLKKAKNKSC